MARRIRSFDWAATPLGPIGGWSERLKVMVEQILASPLVATLVCGTERVLIYNEAAAALYGDRHPDALGRPLPVTFPDGWATVASLYGRAFAGETLRIAGQSLDTRGEGRASDVFDALLTPVRESGGHVAYVHMTGAEVGGRLQAEAALRESETRHRLLIESWAQAVWESDADGVVVADSPSWRAYTGQTLEEWLGYGWVDAIHPEDRSYAERQWRDAIATLRPVDAEFRLRAPDGGWRWTNVRAAPVLDAGGRIEKWAGLNIDIDARKRADIVLRESEERQAYLLDLSDALRPIDDARALRATACRKLGERLSASRVYYVEYEPKAGYGRVADDYLAEGLPSLAGRYPFEAFRATYERIADGTTWIVPDVSGACDLPEHERAYYASQGVRAWINVPLAKNGTLAAAFCAVQSSARAWTALEIALVEETAERLWSAMQRGRAEAGLRESEERFRQFAKASSAGLWIRDAATLAMEFVSPAVGTIYGVEPEALIGDAKGWAAMIAPEDRETALRHLAAASRGEVAVHEFRIQRPSDGAFRWIRSTDFPLHDEGRVSCVGGIAEDTTETRQLTEHQAVLLAELQHRVRNIMALIRSIAAHTGERAESVPDYAALMAGRLMAFARVQTLLTRGANVGVALADVVRDELAAQAGHEDQHVLDGPGVVLSPKGAEVLTLAVHELTTNALKYGGLSDPGARVAVRWATFERRGEPWLGLDWIETGAPGRPSLDPSAPRRRGFGSELIEGRIPYELGGRGRLDITPDGARCRLEFPLREAPSILETDAPRRATVFGGAIAMASDVDLGGQRLLVVEDDYFLASDTARALMGCGAEVLGPCPTETAARDEIAEEMPTGAVLDLNLGQGASFALAADLHARGVPFVIVTGYDEAIVPKEYAAVPLLQKPVQLRQIVSALATAIGGAA